jgi:hypothetical protein
MTARQVYFKAKYLANGFPVAELYYTAKDKEDRIQLWGGSIRFFYRDNLEETLQKMEAIEKTKGFMFWNISTEGKKFYTENWDVIGKFLLNVMYNQK